MKNKKNEQGMILLLTIITTTILTASIAYNINNIKDLSRNLTQLSTI